MAIVRTNVFGETSYTDRNQRFIELFDQLKKDRRIYNATDLSIKLEVDKSYISELRNNKRNLTEQFVDSLVSVFDDVSKEWLLTGEGSMLKEEKPKPVVPVVEAIEISDEEDYQRALSEGRKLIPEYDQDFRGGERGELLSNNSPIGFWQIPTGKAEFVISVSGDSMAPVIPSGAKVCLRPLGFDKNNPNSIPFGSIFAVSVIDPDSGETIGYVKHLRRHSDPTLAKRYWIARSVNTDKYDDFDIEIERVHALFVVEHIIIKSF